jgi:hypothetical protein
MNLQSANFSLDWMSNKPEVSPCGNDVWLHCKDYPGPPTQEENIANDAYIWMPRNGVYSSHGLPEVFLFNDAQYASRYQLHEVCC